MILKQLQERVRFLDVSVSAAEGFHGFSRVFSLDTLCPHQSMAKYTQWANLRFHLPFKKHLTPA